MLGATLGAGSKQRPLGSVVPRSLLFFSQKGKPRWKTSLDKTLADVTKFSCYWVHKVGYVKLRY